MAILTDESMGSDQEFDVGPVLEAGADNVDVLPATPPTMTVAPAADGSIVAVVVPYNGPNPPTDPVILAQFSKAIALGAAPAQALAFAFTVQGAVTGEGKSAVVTIGDVDVPESDTFTLSVVAPVNKPTHLTGDAVIGGLRQQKPVAAARAGMRA